MKKSIILLLCLAMAITTSAQKKLRIKGTLVTKRNIHFVFSGGTLEYFVPEMGMDSRGPIKVSKPFALKDNYANLYFEWKNPLRFKYAWTDSVYDDPDNTKARDFLTSFIGSFGTDITSINKTKGASDGEIEKAGKAPKCKSGKSIDLSNSFYDVNLTTVLLMARMDQCNLTNEEIDAINYLIKDLITLDAEHSNNIAGKVEEHFSTLYGIEKMQEVDGKTADIESEIVKYNKSQEKEKAAQEAVLLGLKKLTIEDAALNTILKNGVSQFVERTSAKMRSDKALIAKLKPLITELRNSTKDASRDFPGFVRIRSIDLEDGKEAAVTLLLTEYKYDEEKKELVKSADPAKTTMIFTNYDRVAVSVSTGLFYGSTKLTGFGVKPSGEGFEVVRDDIEKSSPVTAAFLNFNVSLGSQWISPLIQIGMDPTKKRPMMLLGGGFSVPAGRIALSAGGIWTWDQKLNKLAEGQKITKTTELEADVKYSFDMSPKGWYIGIQYNF